MPWVHFRENHLFLQAKGKGGSMMMTPTKRLSSCLIAVVVATAASSAALPAPALCTDAESYQSSLGLSCFQHRHLNCGGLLQLGLINQQELKDLLVSCPLSCNSPHCSDEHKRLIGAERQEGELTSAHENVRNESSETPIENRAVHRREQSSCYPNWPPSCQDDPLYTNKIGLGCHQMVVFTCDEMHKIGFSEQETYDLINSCPCSCGYMCGSWTVPPTANPSTTSTFSPTSVPTAGPFPTTTLPTATDSFLPTSTPSQQPSTIPHAKTSSSTPITFVPQSLEQQPKSNGAEMTSNTGEFSHTLTISLFVGAGAVISLLAVAAYFSYTKKRKMPPVTEDGTISKAKPLSVGDERGSANAKSKASGKTASVCGADRFHVIYDDEYDSKAKPLSVGDERGSANAKSKTTGSGKTASVCKADRFLVIYDDEYDSKNNEAGPEIAESSLPRPTSPVKSALAQMLQENSACSIENTVQEASLGATTIRTNDQASLRFEDDYIGKVESYSKTEEGDDSSETTPKISNNHQFASSWRTKRLAQLARTKDAATEESKSAKDEQDTHNEDSFQAPVEEEEELDAIKVLSHQSKDGTDFTTGGSGGGSDSPAVITTCTAENSNTRKCDELLDVDGTKAELKQPKGYCKDELKQLRKKIGLSMLESKEADKESTLDEQSTSSTLTDSLRTQDTKETAVVDFLAQGAIEFIGYFMKFGDDEKDDAIEDFPIFSPPAKRTETKSEATSSQACEVPVTNKPMALHTQTWTGHGARVVKGIHQRPLPPNEKPRQHAIIAHHTTDDTDDRSDAYTYTPMTRDTTCVDNRSHCSGSLEKKSKK